ncbi:MAG: transcription antitermination factor NusB [Clostridia bacterium]|nr:transcription antitermination factor NusB [Clostridia bacterium]
MAKIARREARICAIKVLYGIDLHKDMDPIDVFELVCSEGEIPYNDFAKDLFLGTVHNLAKIDEEISKHSKDWKIERLSKISLAILRVCTYELLYTDIPMAIAINEAIEIDKVYDNDDAPSFINGILNAIGKSKSGD